MNAGSCLLVGDIGGTHARFALTAAGTPGFEHEQTFKCADFADAQSAIAQYTGELNVSPTIMCLAVAGPIIDGAVRFTNNDWTIRDSQVSEHFGGIGVKLLNDFEAVAYSIPLIDPADLLRIGTPATNDLQLPEYTVGIVGPGTGLGVAGLCKRRDQVFPIMGEGGHLGFAPASAGQTALFDCLEARFGRVSNERLLSGPGVENIYAALLTLSGGGDENLSAPQIFERAASGDTGLHTQAVSLFFEILGQVAGDVALLLGARQGMYIAGGIVQRYPELVMKSNFRSAFENKGRHRSLMEMIPTSLITYPHPGLLGASYCASEMALAGF